jgi:hypothetical protein
LLRVNVASILTNPAPQWINKCTCPAWYYLFEAPGMIQLVGPNHSLQILGVKLVGLNADTGRKILISVIFLAFVWLLGRFLK